jgi:hypothetical protein
VQRQVAEVKREAGLHLVIEARDECSEPVDQLIRFRVRVAPPPPEPPACPITSRTPRRSSILLELLPGYAEVDALPLSRRADAAGVSHCLQQGHAPHGSADLALDFGPDVEADFHTGHSSPERYAV